VQNYYFTSGYFTEIPQTTAASAKMTRRDSAKYVHYTRLFEYNFKSGFWLA
jgi:hypothetical protein